MDIVEDIIVPQVMCSYCGNTTEPDNEDWVSYGDGMLCNDCFRSCDSCSDVGVGEDMTWASDQIYCEDCASNNLFYCDNCNTYYDHNVESCTDMGVRRLCEQCRDRECSYCERHEEYEYDNDLCDQESYDSDDDDGEQILNEYSHKPDPIFQGVDKHGVYLGWELETVPKENRSFDKMTSAKYAHESLAGLAYLKKDSSIREGFEIVTHPFAHNMVREFTNYWDTIETLRRDHYMRSWDTENCGFHIHISRAGFNGGSHLHRFLQLLYGNCEMMAKMGGRKSNDYADWSDVWKTNEYGVPRRSYAKKVNGVFSSRHSAVNTSNEHTIELRFFRGTMNKSSILAHLDLAHACVEYTRDLRSRDVIDGMLKWDMFMMWVEDNNGIYPDLYVKASKASGVNLNNHETQQA